MKQITITKPDDWHIHLRDDAYLERTVNDAIKQFSRIIVMPNLTPPITTVELAVKYKERITQHISNKASLVPLMTLYLTDNTTPQLIREAKASGEITGCKLYPAGTTTNSANGVTDIKSIYPILEEMEAQDLPLLVHGESLDPNIDIFDREQVFIEQTLIPIIKHFPNLRIVLEHISTEFAVTFVRNANKNVAATITAHHLFYNRNKLLSQGLKPHYYCLPIIKREKDRQALITAATSGNPKFFLGTDSAPHSKHNKENACGCAGIYSAYSAIELYTTLFDSVNALDKLEGFASHFGADFYGLPRNTQTVTLIKHPWKIPSSLHFGREEVIPMFAGEQLDWQIKG